MYPDSEQSHQGQPVIEKGKPLDKARGAVILMHGRGASAQSIMLLYQELRNFEVPGTQPGSSGPPANDLTWLAPQANRNTWYPHPFLSPREHNEPELSSALNVMGELIDKVLTAGIPKDKIILAGFSQGACLSLEYAARNPDLYGGVMALSGGLIGEKLDNDRYRGSMKKTPVFLGCSDYDPHIPESRVHETADVFERLDAAVTKIIYKGLGHTVNRDELGHFQSLVQNIAASD